ncbi:MAG: peptidase S24 [Lentimicrobiaceae bacterium]|nr:peptidase S24 [Lentimicrobiaceae bacterium]MBR3933301.1 peptidase S24 [Clostridia bacterium]
MIERLLQIVEYYKLSVREFERLIGVSEGVINKTIARNTGLKAETIQKIVEKFPQISLNWILLGEGEMLKSDDKPVAKQTDNPNEGIPLIPVEAMAGALTCDNTILEYECDRYVIPMFKGADFLIPVKGSSMYPKYSSGDIVACQRVDMNNLFFQWNKVYVIDTNQGALIKRIKPGHDENHILIVSDNEKYDPFELPYSAIHAVALVIGVIRLE